jgi:hypothetical protein
MTLISLQPRYDENDDMTYYAMVVSDGVRMIFAIENVRDIFPNIDDIEPLLAGDVVHIQQVNGSSSMQIRANMLCVNMYSVMGIASASTALMFRFGQVEQDEFRTVIAGAFT